MFKKVKIVVIIVYILPSDKEEKKKIQQQIIRKIRECEKAKIRVVVMGDFNDIRSKELDQNRVESSRKQVLLLLRWLENSNFEDAFRKIHPDKREFTWSNKISSSRIDYIWVSRVLGQCIMSCETVNAEFITESDHKIVVTKLGTGISQRRKALAKEKRLKGKKQILIDDLAKWSKTINYEIVDRINPNIPRLVKRS